MSSKHYDLAVIGSGPAGQKAAIAAAKLGKRVAIIDRRSMLGGVCLHTGTIPSKTLREAALYLTGFRQRAFYGKDSAIKHRIEIDDLMSRVDEVVKRERAVVHDQLKRNDVEIVDGLARFVEPHALEVDTGEARTIVEGEHVLIACGTRPSRPDHVPFKERRVLDSDDLVRAVGGELPKSVIVVGAGVIGLEYASIAAVLGIAVTIVEARDSMLEYVDEEITEALSYHLRRSGVTFRLGETVASISYDESGPVIACLESGKTVSGDRLLYAVGRQPNTDRLNLDAVGLPVDDRGRISVNERFQTEISHIYAAGDVIGFPALASTSMEQGRLASCHMFGVPCTHAPELLPYAIYSIPEISMVGKTERQLTEQKVPYETGVAHFEEIARAQIIGDRTGLLKLIFRADTCALLGVHIIGDGASELVHIGQSVMAADHTVEWLRDCVFNYPTLAEAYRVAAIDGLNKLQRRRALTPNS
ncbi:MAG: Si-specific NAD(P)(+) transhydrogenase [Planctomycetota bacterium]|nr:Si-specific NAD(P)(+) transhydrogenase [Planctomycetota bacterium]